MTQKIRAVRLDLELEDGVAWGELGEILAGPSPGVEDHDPRGVLSQAELDRGAEHAGGWKAEKGLGFDAPLAKARTRRSIRHPVSHGDVPGAGDHLHHRSAGRHGGDLVLRRSGKRP